MEKAQLLRRLGWPYVSKLISRQTYLTMSTAPVYLAAVILALSISKAGKSGDGGMGRAAAVRLGAAVLQTPSAKRPSKLEALGLAVLAEFDWAGR